MAIAVFTFSAVIVFAGSMIALLLSDFNNTGEWNDEE